MLICPHYKQQMNPYAQSEISSVFSNCVSDILSEDSKILTLKIFTPFLCL